MKSFHRNRGGLALLLVLTLVLTMSGSPALARACGELAASSRAAVPSPERASHCETTSTANGCCCTAPGGKPAVAGDTGSPVVGRAAHHGCGCSLEAPAYPAPSERKTSARVLSAGVAILPGAAPAVPLPALTPGEFGAPANGPPARGDRASAPSRAPPAR